MAFLNPKNWSIACWAMLLLWLYPSVMMNLPLEPSSELNELGETHPDGTRYASYDHTALIGWPFIYLEIASNGSKQPIPKFNPFYAAANFALVALTLLGIVSTLHTWLPQFSIRTMLIAMAGLAFLIVVAQAVFSTDNFNLQTGFMLAVYFIPLVAGLACVICTKLKQTRRIAV